MNFLQKYWQGKKVVITGASSGLGWSICEALSKYKIHFALLSRREEKMNELAEKLKNTGSTFWVRACDLCNQKQVESAIFDFAEEANGIDVVWINGGVSYDSSMDNWDWDKIETMIDTNIKGAIYTAKASLDIMNLQKSGTLVGIGSAASMRGLPRRSVYSMTKIGIQFFLEGMAVESPHLQFTTIHPGYVDTPINNKSPNRMFLIDPETASRLMITAVAKRKHVYVYPWKMRFFYNIVKRLPHFFYYKLAKKMKNLSRPSKKIKN